MRLRKFQQMLIAVVGFSLLAGMPILLLATNISGWRIFWASVFLYTWLYGLHEAAKEGV